MNTHARPAVVTLPDLLPLLAVTADMRRRWWVLVEKPSYQDTLKPFPQSTARQRWVLAFTCTALKAGLPLRDDTDRRGWRSLEDPVIWACDEANWRAMGGHPDALRRNKHGGLRAAVQDQLISRWRAMARIGVTTVWAAPDGRYIGAHGDGVRSPVADRGDDRKPGGRRVAVPQWGMQDIESDTGYDTRRCGLGGAFAGVSQTAVYDTC